MRTLPFVQITEYDKYLNSNWLIIWWKVKFSLHQLWNRQGTGSIELVSFTLRPLYPKVKSVR